MGPTLFAIPAEEIFFFVVQTYNTSLLYLLLSKPTLHPIYLRGGAPQRDRSQLRLWRTIGQIGLLGAIVMGALMVGTNGEGMYMGLIVVWAGPFLLLLWYETSMLRI